MFCPVQSPAECLLPRCSLPASVVSVNYLFAPSYFLYAIASYSSSCSKSLILNPLLSFRLVNFWASFSKTLIGCLPVSQRSTVQVFTSGLPGIRIWLGDSQSVSQSSGVPFTRVIVPFWLETVTNFQHSRSGSLFTKSDWEARVLFTCQEVTAIRFVCLCFDTCHMHWLHARG